MDVSLFDFDLPEDRIALRPVSPRESAKLLQVKDAEFSDHLVSDLPSLLKAGDVLVVNETKVIKASLTGIRPARPHGGGGEVSVQINLHKRVSPQAWMAFCRPAKRLKVNDILSFDDGLFARVSAKSEGGEIRLEFSLSGPDLYAAIAAAGQMPLPPYIAKNRPSDSRDETDYQTVYAASAGSVAAPTAGLHYSVDLLNALAAADIDIVRITLHVGAGTFLLVSAENTDDHKMHSEWYEISETAAQSLQAAKADGRRIIAVGTTALRALESSAAFNGQVKAEARDTDIFITPGYEFAVADGLLTNFHLPKSTLFMLVSAFAGLETMQAAYAHAISAHYRFYSYGDTSLLWKAA